jgi:hypothetical protein
MCESFFATLECELLDRRRFTTQAEARMAVFDPTSTLAALGGRAISPYARLFSTSSDLWC